MKSGNLKFLEPCGPLQASNGTALPFFFNVKLSMSVCPSCCVSQKIKIIADMCKYRSCSFCEGKLRMAT